MDRGVVKRLKGLTLGALLVFLLLSLLSGQVRAADVGTIEVGITPNPLTVVDVGSIEVGMTPNPLTVSVSAPSEVIKHKNFTVTAQIQNLSDENIDKVVATIHPDETDLRVGKKKVENDVGKIRPHEVITVDWQVKAKKTATYIILVSVSGEGETGDLTAQDNVTVTVTERSRGLLGLLQGWYQLFIGG